MKGVFKFAVIGEGLMGVALLLAPDVVTRLLLGAELNEVGVTTSRVAGIALIGLAISCLPGRAVVGMLTYSAIVMLYLGYIGIVGRLNGILLWPAVAIHAGVSVLLARVCFTRTQPEQTSN